jgi:hypothetical protein
MPVGIVTGRDSITSRLRPILRENSLSLVFFVAFLAAVAGQSVAGLHAFNEEQVTHGQEAVSYGRYLLSSHFGEALVENWQSEFLQFAVFILATVWLVQRGSPESKALDKAGVESKKEQRLEEHADTTSPKWARVGGLRTWLFSNSLLLVMGSLFVASWLAQSFTGWSEYNLEQEEHGEATIGWAGYVSRPDFWEKTLQNWQSEFLAVGCLAVFAVYLRQRGSAESKPVGATHDETETSG